LASSAHVLPFIHSTTDIFLHISKRAGKNTVPYILFFVVLDSKGKMINYGPKDYNTKPAIREHNLKYQKTITKYILERSR
jgi:hypothetical protein